MSGGERRRVLENRIEKSSMEFKLPLNWALNGNWKFVFMCVMLRFTRKKFDAQKMLCGHISSFSHETSKFGHYCNNEHKTLYIACTTREGIWL